MKFSKMILLAIATSAVAYAMYLSIDMNVIFGENFGTTPREKQLLGHIAGTLDLIKSFMPVVAAIVLAYGFRWLWLGSWGIWAVLAILSVSAAWGFVVKNRADSGANRGKESGQYARLESKIKEKQAALNKLGVVDTVLVAETNLHNEKHRRIISRHRRLRNKSPWEVTQGCRLNNKYEPLFCPKIRTLEAAVAAARSARDLTSDIAGLEKQLAKTKAVGGSDPQMAAFEKLSGLSSFYVMVALAALFAIGIELATGFGPPLIFRAFVLVSADQTVEKSGRWSAFLSRMNGLYNGLTKTGHRLPVEQAVQSIANDNKALKDFSWSGFLNGVGVVTPQDKPAGDVAVYYDDVVSYQTFSDAEMPSMKVFDHWRSWCDFRGFEAGSYNDFVSSFNLQVMNDMGDDFIIMKSSGRRYADRCAYRALHLEDVRHQVAV